LHSPVAKTVFTGFAGTVLGRGTRRAPLSQSRSASQWIAATIFKVTSGNEQNDRNSVAVVRRAGGR
jgi:hypothetical protein